MEDIIVSNNNIDDEGLVELASALGNNTSFIEESEPLLESIRDLRGVGHLL